MTNTAEGASYELVGAVSWGNGPCTSRDYPGVYARVTSMIDWINVTTSSDWSSCPTD